jgi:serine/threonine-protein phosphatase 2A regulatory subunit B'
VPSPHSLPPPHVHTALPLKSEHKRFLERVLLPLHRIDTSFRAFHPHLVYCISQFLQKDPSLTPLVVSQLVRMWPRANSAKELLMLGELEEILGLCEIDVFQSVEK